ARPRADHLPAEALTPAAVEQVVVGVEGLEAADVAEIADPDGLHDPRAGPPADLAAERGALVAVELHHGEAQHVGQLDDPSEPLVDEHARQLHLAPHRTGDATRLLDRAG